MLRRAQHERFTPFALSLARASRSKGGTPRAGRSYFDKLNTNGLPTTVGCSRFDQAQHERMWVVHASTSSARTVYPVRPEPRACESAQGPALSFAHARQSKGERLEQAVHISTSSIRTVLPFALSLARARQSKGERLAVRASTRLSTNGVWLFIFRQAQYERIANRGGLFALRPGSARTDVGCSCFDQAHHERVGCSCCDRLAARFSPARSRNPLRFSPGPASVAMTLANEQRIRTGLRLAGKRGARVDD
jgi:hypothetical protein